MFEPAAIMPMSAMADADDEDDGDNLTSSNNNKQSKASKSSKSSKQPKKQNKKQSSSSKSNKLKSKKQSYVMISPDEDEDDDDMDDDIDDDEYEDVEAGHMMQTDDINNTTLIVQSETGHDRLEEIQLTSPIHQQQEIMTDDTVKLVDLNNAYNHNDNDHHHHLSESRDHLTSSSAMEMIDHRHKTKYGLSAYYGVRLDYRDTKCHDIGWCILWILHCIGIIVVLVCVWTWTSSAVHMPHATNGIFILSFLLAFAVLFAFLWTFILRYCGGFIVWVLIIGNLIVLGAFASFCFIVGDRFFGLGIIFSILFVIFAVFTLCIRKRITYTIALLQLGSSILVTTPSALFISIGVLIMQIIWIFIWGSIIVAFSAHYYHTNSSSQFGGILIILIISFIWNHQVFKNIGHTTICAVIAHWYFSPNTPYPTCKALCRCLTTSLGSIAFGSMFVNILQGFRAYLRVLRDETFSCCQCGKFTLNCFLSCFDGLLEYFNTYAFVHIAVYNTAYLKSGKNTFDLLSISRIYPLMNSNFTEYALLCGSICGGIINGILASWIANVMQVQKDWVVMFTCGGFLIGMSLSSSLLNAVSSCIIALFVLYAEEPSLLCELHPEQALRFDGAKKGIA